MLVTSNDNTDLKAKLFRGLADPTRLGILETLGDRRLCVGDIVDATNLSQSNVSNHLSCLKDCGLVSSERQGRNVYYRISDRRVNALLELSRELLADVAKGVYECTRYRQPSGSASVAEGEQAAEVAVESQEIAGA